MGLAPPDDGRGAIAHWIDYLFGNHWEQRVQSMCGYAQTLIGTVAGGSILTTQIQALNWPLLSNNWPKITAVCLVLNGILSGVSKRFSKTATTVGSSTNG